MTDNPLPPEEPVSRQWIYQGRVINLSRDTVQLYTGRQALREIVHHPGAVAGVPLSDDGQVVLVRQYRYAVGRALLEIPAGGLRVNEDPADCLQRELAEEIGLAARRVDRLMELHPSPGCLTELLHLYLARDLYPAVGQPDDDENLQIVTMPLAEAIDCCVRGEICDGKSVAGLFLARELLANEMR
jgi:ADP-ribose pyrophosphatase